MYALISFYVATKRMTTFDEVFQGENEISISWTPPIVLPINLIHTVSCKLWCDPTTYYLTETATTRLNHSTTFAALQPGSICLIRLLAVYNPASIDPGIGLSCHTHFSGKFFVNLHTVYTNIFIGD